MKSMTELVFNVTVPAIPEENCDPERITEPERFLQGNLTKLYNVTLYDEVMYNKNLTVTNETVIGLQHDHCKLAMERFYNEAGK